MNGVLLQDFGLQQWYPRKLRHPWYKKNNVIVEVTPAILKIKCLILLPMYTKKEFSLQANKVLSGMLGVLALAKDELSIAKIYTNNNFFTKQDKSKINEEIQIWQPQFILQLEKNTTIIEDNKVLQTYHPEHLVMHQEDKTLAYQELLTIKQKLHTYD
jgi:hypothetical protein